MPKKQPKNSFFFFMLDVKRKEEARGHRFRNGLAEVSELASPRWQKLTPDEKLPYENEAKKAKLAPSGAQGERYTTQGIPFSQIDSANTDAKNREENMHKEINHLVKQSYLNNTISSQEYIFIAGNYFCKTHDGVYVPAELALVKYNASEGYGNKYHVFINPGQLPSGYAYEAQNRSKTVHRLPPPPKAYGDNNYNNILQNILKFIGAPNSRSLPPIFTNTDQETPIKSMIEQLCKESEEDSSNFRIYSLAQLFYVLKNETSKYALNERAFSSVHIAQTMIDRDQYDYRSNLACTFHEEVDASKFCALSYVIRWSFIISDHICSDLAIKLIPGRHVPSDSDVYTDDQPKDDIDDSNSIVSAAPSMSSNFTTRTAYTQWNNDSDSIAASVASFNEANFPAIGGGRNSNRSSVSIGVNDAPPQQGRTNHWSDRFEDVREPLNTSLSFPILGRGRGVSNTKSHEANRPMGRGRYH